jgi:hypothetical protein
MVSLALAGGGQIGRGGWVVVEVIEVRKWWSL